MWTQLMVRLWVRFWGLGDDRDKNREWALCLLRTALHCQESRLKKKEEEWGWGVREQVGFKSTRVMERQRQHHHSLHRDSAFQLFSEASQTVMFLSESEISVSTNLSGLGSSCCLSEFLFRLAKISTAYPGLLTIHEVSAIWKVSTLEAWLD